MAVQKFKGFESDSQMEETSIWSPVETIQDIFFLFKRN